MPPTPASTSPSRSPGRAAASRSSAPARRTSTTLRGRSRTDDAKEGTACKANNVTYVQLQVAIDGLTVVVNPANTLATCLTLEQLKTIYGPDSPENLTWNQVDPPGRTSRSSAPCPARTRGRSTTSPRSSTARSTRRPRMPSSPRTTTSSCRPSRAIPTRSATSATRTTLRTTTRSRPSRSTAAPAASSRRRATIGDGTYAPLSRPLFIYPNTAKAKESPALYEFVNYYLANAAARGRGRLRGGPGRRHRASSGGLDCRRPRN